jgi:hypothetical protein
MAFKESILTSLGPVVGLKRFVFVCVSFIEFVFTIWSASCRNLLAKFELLLKFWLLLVEEIDVCVELDEVLLS